MVLCGYQMHTDVYNKPTFCMTLRRSLLHLTGVYAQRLRLLSHDSMRSASVCRASVLCKNG